MHIHPKAENIVCGINWSCTLLFGPVYLAKLIAACSVYRYNCCNRQLKWESRELKDFLYKKKPTFFIVYKRFKLHFRLLTGIFRWHYLAQRQASVQRSSRARHPHQVNRRRSAQSLPAAETGTEATDIQTHDWWTTAAGNHLAFNSHPSKMPTFRYCL